LLKSVSHVVRVCTGLGIAIGATAANAQETVIRPVGIALSFDSTYHTWKGRNGDSGSQWFTTTSVGIARAFENGSSLDLALRSGYVSSINDTPGRKGSVRSLVDTTLHAKLSFLGDSRFQPFLTLGVNLPTGKATLFGNEQNALMDRDLVPQGRFGEGFNINPGIGVTVPLNPFWIASAAVGYNLRGAYVANGDTGRKYNPGDQVIGTIGLTYASQRTLFSLTAIYTSESTSTLDGVDFFKPGDSIALNTQIAHAWNDRHQTRLTLAVNKADRNRFSDFFAGGFTEESQNSNSTVYQAALAHTTNVTGSLSLTGTLGYLQRTKNAYAPSSDFYTPAKERISLGLSTTYRINDTMSVRADIEAFRLHREETPFFGAQNYKGANVHASFDIRF
jgi:hypothetical protein